MVSGNVTTGNGGGIAGPFIPGQQGAVLTRTTVRGNHADGGGGGIYSVQASLVDSTVTQNSAGGSGGGLYVANFVGGMTTFGTLSLAGTTVTGNTAGLSAAESSPSRARRKRSMPRAASAATRRMTRRSACRRFDATVRRGSAAFASPCHQRLSEVDGGARSAA